MPQINPATGKRIVGRPFQPGQSGNPGGSAARARRDLNADTIREMHRAFRDGGRAAIDKVMKQSPAIFLKLLVLLVPRELEVTHTGGVKAMTDEQLEAGIAAVEAMLARRAAGDGAKVIEESAVPQKLEDSAPRPTRRKAVRTMDAGMGSAPDEANS
jgi:hypothetical protein